MFFGTIGAGAPLSCQYRRGANLCSLAMRSKCSQSIPFRIMAPIWSAEPASLLTRAQQRSRSTSGVLAGTECVQFDTLTRTLLYQPRQAGRLDETVLPARATQQILRFL